MPSLDGGTLQKLGPLVEQCWATSPKHRPPFSSIVAELESISRITPQRSSLHSLEEEHGGDALDSLLGC